MSTILDSNSFNTSWEKIEEKHDKIINCCGMPKNESPDSTRRKFWDNVADLQKLLTNVDEAKETAEVKIMESLEPYEDFTRDAETEGLLQLSLGIYRDIHNMQDHIDRVYPHSEDDSDYADYPDDWIAVCRRGVECCLKQGKMDCVC